MNVKEEVLQAEQRIRPYVRETMLEHSPHYSELGGANVYFKLENLQHTGSFKVRGALSKVLSLSKEQRAAGVVTASSGNHGAAVAYSVNKTKDPAVVFVPENASPVKIAAIEHLGAEVRLHGLDAADSEARARCYASEEQLAYVPPYNDPQVIGGQGTIGIELERQLDHIDALFIALGGGGLISGVAGYLKAASPATRVFGCSPINSQVMIESIRANRILDMSSEPTLSDGTAGGVEPDSITFELVRDLVDDYVSVSEDEIKACLRQFLAVHHMLIEGAAAVALAAYLQRREELAGKNVVVLICGANISLDTLKTIL